MIPGDSSSPTAQQTIFGWVLCGPMSAAETPVSAHAHHCSPDQELQDLLSRLWTQEEIPKSTTAELTEEEEECERHFLTTIHEMQRADMCTFQQFYGNFLEEYLKMGHMKEVDASSDQTSVVNYLPHHGVLRENNRTTKLRVVFNGSSPTSNGLSLNDILHAGAKLQIDICDILLWIRRLEPTEKLWIGSEQQLLAYCLTTVTYGLRCAPFLALRALEQLLKEEGHRFPKAIIPMKKGRFVDNIYGGSDTTLEAKDIIQQVKGLCEAGGFSLHEWSSNYPDLLPNSEEGGPTDIEIDPTFCKLLGLVWRPFSDTLHFFSTVPGNITFTKRAIASDIAKLYDPLGLISPIIIRAKIILQELWLLKTGWDELIPVTLQERWTAF
ncbi:uncharacterized protein LOC112461353 [Temnothorax curvispinosus]|uniref:Uncharacterized protein LOC112461353 n=1 Tax=Temnothorax curvispinosus TaxID=300111 RepID=A0A6J1QP65_9HYME|nr:uncharacterized protein LOC112461353 [Temnothorax curvispinosus]